MHNASSGTMKDSSGTLGRRKANLIKMNNNAQDEAKKRRKRQRFAKDCKKVIIPFSNLRRHQFVPRLYYSCGHRGNIRVLFCRHISTRTADYLNKQPLYAQSFSSLFNFLFKSKLTRQARLVNFSLTICREFNNKCRQR